MKNNLNTLGLKLKRHKLSYSYNEETDSLEIGKSLNKNKKLITGIILIVLTVLILFSAGLALSSVHRSIRKYIIILLVLPTGSAGVKQIYSFIALSKGNNENKIFKRGSVLIDKRNKRKEFMNDEILGIDFIIKEEENGSSRGTIFLVNKEKETTELLTLIDDDYKYLKNDLTFINNLIKEFIGLKA